MELWTELKTKLRTLKNDHQVLITNHQKKFQEQEELINKLREAVQSKYDFPTRQVDLRKITHLESKLEKVKNFLADNQIERLKRMVGRGEI